MKKYLYLDTSFYIYLGLLNENFEWIEYKVIPDKKSSRLLHKEIFDLLSANGIKSLDISGIFLSSGPGSYTGLRLAEGVSQIFELESIPVYSFYHFEVPSFIGVQSGLFCAEAFKGEVFVYNWDNEENEDSLMKIEKFHNLDLAQDNIFHIEGEIFEYHFSSTSFLVKKHSAEIFNKVFARKKHLDTYYFRPLEKEFTVSVKGV